MDRFSKTVRSGIMSKIKGRNTNPERKYHKMLLIDGIRHKMQPKLFGHPDVLIFPNTIIFINGCFWHGCPRHYKQPKSNIFFWKNKIRKNKIRQLKVIRELKHQGYEVKVIWEHNLQ